MLVHCFAGCSVEQVLSAVGLTFDALFPEKTIKDYLPRLRAPFPAADVLECLNTEIAVMQICAGDLSRGELTKDARERMEIACQRITDAMELALGKR